ncbi:triose-phosphate isomerase [Candidatus Finniella inopinata]|uniref:Triosephosphate isomerase n=1 Tax=Candidatus Finniella inopinata TaxID=1696036 RepID=A0A4Q7DJ61_9PROT|nr:triose-phosphate isomerase [Candidatus Finniella inopinata]RZI46064.1 triose-phosphate isomerase [Candidatus Finniella inopinata]
MKTIVANWKMNGSLDLLNQAMEAWQLKSGTNKVILCLPSVFLSAAHTLLRQPNFFLGGQDCHAALQGAFTGDTSAHHLYDAGCRYVLVGHSERRQHHHESNAMVKAKAQAAVAAGLTPIICVGESLEQREQGLALSVLQEQVEQSIPDNATDFYVAYEPIWAIGTGRVAALEDIQQVHAFLKQQLGVGVKLLYGGSVTADNHAFILSLENVDGVLVGGASLKIDDLGKMVRF